MAVSVNIQHRRTTWSLGVSLDSDVTTMRFFEGTLQKDIESGMSVLG